MKWYNYKNYLFNLNEYLKIVKSSSCENAILFYDQHEKEMICYADREERDAEFEKIKALMGITVMHPTNMTPMNDWTPGRCC